MLTKLSSCQNAALKTLNQKGKNIFLTGQAGTGKSHLIQLFLKDKDKKLFPAIASTGAAAVLIGGRTFHSFFGLGVMEGGLVATVERAASNKRVIKRLKEIEGFVLDEVSMIPGLALRAAETLCRIVRKIQVPWGGLHVIATGDFSQLPPVAKSGEMRDWAFLDEAWTRSEFEFVSLNTPIRTQDNNFMSILADVRVGNASSEVESYLQERVDPTVSEDLFNPCTYLFPLRAHAEKLNLMRLEKIAKKIHEIPTEYKGTTPAIEQLRKNAPIPELLCLKESALVMIRINDPALKFVNGSLAKVVDIGKKELILELLTGREVHLEKHAFVYMDGDGREAASAINFPVTLAYATTIHKAQGATIDQMVCDLRRLWEPGQAYVALSRVRSGKDLSLLGFDASSIKADPLVGAFYEAQRQA